MGPVCGVSSMQAPRLYSANLEAVRWFVSQVLPHLDGAAPNVPLHVTGTHAGIDVRELAAAGVAFEGHVADIRRFVASSAVAVVPLRSGGGTRLKILEAMAMGTPVVSTSKGAEGLDVRHGEHLLIADDGPGFAAGRGAGARGPRVGGPPRGGWIPTGARSLHLAPYRARPRRRRVGSGGTVQGWARVRAHRRQWLVLSVLSLLLLTALTWRLTEAPPWIDEGLHNTAAATFARTGAYGLPLLDRVVPFDPTIGVGPTVIVPIAMAMKVFGVEPVVGRAVVLFYAVLAWAIMWGLLVRLGSRRAALVSLAFVLVGTHEPFQSFAFVGRQVIGEVPALAFCLAGYLSLAWRTEWPLRSWRAVVAGLCFGAAMITKGQLVFVLLPAVALGWIVDRTWHRRWAWWVFPLASVVAVTSYGAWLALQVAAIGMEQYAANAALLRFGLQTQVLAFEPAFARRAAGSLARAGFVPFGLIGIVHATLAARHRTPAGALHSQMLVFCLTATAWFLTGSIGWARYGFYATIVAMLWWGGAVEALGEKVAARTGSRWPGRALLALALLAAIVTASPSWRELMAPEDRGYAAVRSWIDANVAPGAIVETWESELMLDDRVLFSYPGLRTLYEATSMVMGGRSAPRLLDYDPLRASPQWLVQGRFGGWTGVYAQVIASGRVNKVVQFGEYAVYRVEAATRCAVRPRANRVRVVTRVLAIALGLFVLGFAPYWYAWHSSPPSQFYTGLMFNVPDHAQYWSWVTASRHGLFISNTMTPEPNPPVFMNPMMWLLAQVQQAGNLTFAQLFQAWRLLAALMVVAAMWFVTSAFCRGARQRGTAFWLILLGSGLGWVMVAAKYALGLGDAPFPHDIYTAEPNTWWGLLAYPYLPIAQALVVLTLTFAWRSHRAGGAGAVVGAALASLCLALTHAYDLLTVYTTLGAFGLVLWIRDRRLPRRLTVAGIAIAAASGPVAFYYKQLTAGDPLWQAILAQYPNAGVWTPPHVHLVVLMGFPLLLAAAALAWRLVDGDDRLFVATWAGCGLVLIYVPVVYQIKMLTAWQVPLAILAVAAWNERVTPALSRWLRERGRVRLSSQVTAYAGAALVAATLPTNAYLFAWRFTELKKHEAPYFLHVDERAALDWLAANSTPEDVVLAPLSLGQYVPNLGATRAFVAHWAMTVRFFERRDESERFFASATDAAVRRRTIEANGITLVLRPTTGRYLTSWDPGCSTGYERVFDAPGAQVYRVRAGVGSVGS